MRAGASPLGKYIELLYQIEERGRGLSNAAVVMAPYMMSPDTAIARQALLMMNIYLRLMSIDSSIAASVRAIVRAEGPLDVTEEAQKMARVRADSRALLGGMAAIVGDATSLLVREDPQTRRSVGLDITAGRRGELLALLKVRFGPALNPKDGKWASDYAMLASMVRQFLTQRWELRQ